MQSFYSFAAVFIQRHVWRRIRYLGEQMRYRTFRTLVTGLVVRVGKHAQCL